MAPQPSPKPSRTSPEWRPSSVGDETQPLDPREVLSAVESARKAAEDAQAAATKAAKVVATPAPKPSRPKPAATPSPWPWIALTVLILALGAAGTLITWLVLAYGSLH